MLISMKVEFEVLTNYMLNKQLKDLYRKAKLALEENGANSLFLAIGFLTWNDQKY